MRMGDASTQRRWWGRAGVDVAVTVAVAAWWATVTGHAWQRHLTLDAREGLNGGGGGGELVQVIRPSHLRSEVCGLKVA